MHLARRERPSFLVIRSIAVEILAKRVKRANKARVFDYSSNIKPQRTQRNAENKGTSLLRVPLRPLRFLLLGILKRMVRNAVRCGGIFLAKSGRRKSRLLCRRSTTA